MATQPSLIKHLAVLRRLNRTARQLPAARSSRRGRHPHRQHTPTLRRLHHIHEQRRQPRRDTRNPSQRVMPVGHPRPEQDQTGRALPLQPRRRDNRPVEKAGISPNGSVPHTISRQPILRRQSGRVNLLQTEPVNIEQVHAHRRCLGHRPIVEPAAGLGGGHNLRARVETAQVHVRLPVREPVARHPRPPRPPRHAPRPAPYSNPNLDPPPTRPPRPTAGSTIRPGFCYLRTDPGLRKASMLATARRGRRRVVC